MHQEQLFPLIHRNVQKNLNGYISAGPITDSIDTYIVPPALGDNAGLVGALELGIRALGKSC
jgi:fructokinase